MAQTPQQRELSRRQKHLEALQVQINQKEQRLDSLKQQESLAVQRRASLLKNIEDAAAVRKSELLLDIDNQVSEARQTLTGIKAETVGATVNLKSLKEEIIDVDNELHELEIRQKNVAQSVGLLKKEETELYHQIETEKEVVEALNKRKSSLESELNTIKDDISNFSREKMALESENQALQAEISESRSSHVIEAQSWKDKLQKAREDTQVAIDRLREVANKDKVMRDELVTERLRLDKWEENLKRREFIVDQGEGKLQENARLLNL